MTESHIRNVIEAALLAAGKPLQPAELVELFDEGSSRPTLTVVQAALAALAEEYSNRGVEIKETAAGFRIQVRSELSNEISRLWPERPPKYTRAFLETLALIAYRQPITRAEIEAVRGVAVNPNILKMAIERNWVRVLGHRDVPGRPELLGTTRDFLDYFGLRSLDELPPLAELKAIGEIKVQFDLPDPGQLPPEGESSGVAVDGTTAAVGADAAGTSEAEGTKLLAHEAAAVEGGAADPAATDTGSSDADSGPANAHSAATSVDATTTEATTGEAATGEATTAEAIATGPTDVDTTDAAAAATDTTRSTATDGAEETPADSDVAKTATADDGHDTPTSAAPKPTGRGSGRKKRRGKASASDTALHEAEEFVASVDADLSGDDDSSDEDELSAAGPDSTELVAGPRDIDS